MFRYVTAETTVALVHRLDENMFLSSTEPKVARWTGLTHDHDPLCCARRVLDRDGRLHWALAGGGAADDQRDAVGDVHGVGIRILEAHVRDATGAWRRRIISVTTAAMSCQAVPFPATVMDRGPLYWAFKFFWCLPQQRGTLRVVCVCYLRVLE